MGSLKYFLDRWRNRKNSQQLRVMTTDEHGKPHARANFEEAFGFAGYGTAEAAESDVRLRGNYGYDENIRLAPYIRFSRSRTQALPGVMNGDQTDEVLAAFGATAGEIADLRQRGVVA